MEHFFLRSTCDSGFWTGVCVDSKYKSDLKGPQICRPYCSAAPVLDPSAHVELVDSYDKQNAWEGDVLTVKCKDGFEAARGSFMKIICINGGWSDFMGICLRDCSELTEEIVLGLVAHAKPGAPQPGVHLGHLDGDLALLECIPPYVTQGLMGAVCRCDGYWTKIGTGECVNTLLSTGTDAIVQSIHIHIKTEIEGVTFTNGDVLIDHVSTGCSYAGCQVYVKECKSSDLPSGYKISSDGKTATKQCQGSTTDKLTITCDSNGNWGSTNRTCPAKACKSSDLPSGYKISSDGKTATKQCQGSTTDKLTITCDSNGNWGSTNRTCPAKGPCSIKIPFTPEKCTWTNQNCFCLLSPLYTHQDGMNKCGTEKGWEMMKIPDIHVYKWIREFAIAELPYYYGGIWFAARVNMTEPRMLVDSYSNKPLDYDAPNGGNEDLVDGHCGIFPASDGGVDNWEFIECTTKSKTICQKSDPHL